MTHPAENVARRPGCEMYGCAAVAVGIGDIDGDEFWLCDGHRYPAPRTTENDAPRADVRCGVCGVACCHGHPLRWLRARVIPPVVGAS